MMSRLLPSLLALVLLAAPASFAATSGLDDGGSILDRMGDTGSVLGSSARQAPVGPSTAARDCNGDGIDDGPAPCLPPNAPAVPVDGGLTLLALAGAGYATRKLRARRA